MHHKKIGNTAATWFDVRALDTDTVKINQFQQQKQTHKIGILFIAYIVEKNKQKERTLSRLTFKTW